ncbi:NADP-dependent oxidoreductase [Kutzneria buriramensis]|uniref:NADPH:quinone reductase-like Zn-dependent oxidoreductase n=1 Tax=Kutzneria buriramensis TaxID=1045776 RepID=A0A3E0G6V7_9PSEU|nr:NADP-dependent oxidoreductase [Kutzneria buriramensis]REH17940.1 NADPH:quinone reductase-like Zn-dependent oxidoreductase [Kutzneria buriramensis]
MRAVTFTDFGGPDVLAVDERPIPEVPAGHVRVKVHAAAVHPLDTVARAGWLGPMVPAGPTYVLGVDAAGTVDEVGSGVTDFAVGNAVLAMSNWPQTKIGCQAEYVVLPADFLAPAPAGVDFEAASTLPLNGHTAAQALKILGRKEGDQIVVTGAAGAIGAFAVQLALHQGLRVIAIAAPEDEPFITGIGATFVARGGNSADAVRAVAPEGVDGVLDTAGIGAGVIGAVRDGGSFVAVTPPAMPPAERGIRVGLVQAVADGAELTELSGLVDSGRLTLRVARTFPFEQAADAHALLAKGGLRGGVVLVPRG